MFVFWYLCLIYFTAWIYAGNKLGLCHLVIGIKGHERKSLKYIDNFVWRTVGSTYSNSGCISHTSTIWKKKETLNWVSKHCSLCELTGAGSAWEGTSQSRLWRLLCEGKQIKLRQGLAQLGRLTVFPSETSKNFWNKDFQILVHLKTMLFSVFSPLV